MTKMIRYVVRPCDNGESIEGLVRQRTWDVICKKGGDQYCVASFLTRREAYAHKRSLQHEPPTKSR